MSVNLEPQVFILISEQVYKRDRRKIANIYDAGFQFIYFDGSEGVNPPPFGINVGLAQYRVFKRLEPQPLFAEGAAKSHFSWHMLSGGNAFDIFRPEVLKEETRKWPAEEASRMRHDFTRINFGWLGYWAPGEATIGTQPDMLEYVTSIAAAWDCPHFYSFQPRGICRSSKNRGQPGGNSEMGRGQSRALAYRRTENSYRM